jgi:hypothetical protein
MGERAPADLDRGLNPARLRRPDAGLPQQPHAWNPAEPAHAADAREQSVGDVERVAAGAAVADEHREQLVVAERRGAGRLQLLTRAVVDRQRADRSDGEIATSAANARRRCVILALT